MAEEFLEDKAVITGQERASSPPLLLGWTDCDIPRKGMF